MRLVSAGYFLYTRTRHGQGACDVSCRIKVLPWE